MSSSKNNILIIFFSTIITVLCFSFNPILWFYIYFEISLIPLVLLILNKGINPERFKALSFFILYTSLGSFPLLFNILTKITF